MKNLKIFTDDIEPEALRQVNALMDQPAFADSKVRIMPDVHAGKGCVIGFTGDLGDKVIPNIVGVDIGCGMYCACLGRISIDYEKLDDFIVHFIPSGHAVNEKPVSDFYEYYVRGLLAYGLKCRDSIVNQERIIRSMGSLGGGNHFIEIDEGSDGCKYLVIHSGSRNLGKQVAEFYQDLACSYLHARHSVEKQAIIDRCKRAGLEQLIEGRIRAFEATDCVPDELAYLEGAVRENYLHDMDLCQSFAQYNRRLIAQRIMDFMDWDVGYDFESIHNYISFVDNIVRKGAISARKGEEVIIPINMRDGCIIGRGRGNTDWNCSAPHGAGRIMSRGEAKAKLTLKDFGQSMQGIYSTSVCKGTLDEAPMAYRSLDDILKRIEDTVEVIQVIRPVYNFKAMS